MMDQVTGQSADVRTARLDPGEGRSRLFVAAMVMLMLCGAESCAETYGLLPERKTSALPASRVTALNAGVTPIGRATRESADEADADRTWWKRSAETAVESPRSAPHTAAKRRKSLWSRFREAATARTDDPRAPETRSPDGIPSVEAAVEAELARQQHHNRVAPAQTPPASGRKSSAAMTTPAEASESSALHHTDAATGPGCHVLPGAKRGGSAPPRQGTQPLTRAVQKPQLIAPPHANSPIRLVSDVQTVDESSASPAPRTAGVGDAIPFAGNLLQQFQAAPPAPPAPAPEELRVPIQRPPQDARIEISSRDDRVSMVVREGPISHVLGLIAEQHGLNLVTAEDVTGSVSVTLNDVSLESALNAILGVNGYTWTRQHDIIIVSSLSTESSAGASSQGRELRVFNLNYLAAADADAVVQGLLSPVGKSFTIQSDPLDKLRTREQLVVEDLPAYLHRISSYLAQADCPPRQVQIEAHILQIDLSDDTRHGVDFEALLARIDSARIGLETTGFTNPDESPAFFFGVDGTDMNVLMQAIKSTSNAKTLASPKVLVVNGQEARIQIGAQLGFLVTTTTQTSTLQEVQFLDVGVVLRVTPQIAEDGRILMTVKPQVSTGEVNPLTGLPQEETTEVETTVMLNNGKGMVIGGLIQEADTEDQSKLPIAGDLWLVGKLFRRVRTIRSRSEIVIALVPRLVPYTPAYAAQEEDRLLRATSPLLGPHLERVDRRPLEPELPDAMRNPRRFDPERAKDWFRQHGDPYPYPKTHYFPSADGDVNMYGYFPRDPEVLGGHETYFEQWPAEGAPPIYAPPPSAPTRPADAFPPPAPPFAPPQ
ncbi:MAG: hypothetical protein ACF8TS_17260 [Maioricimonas sp. JB049]